MKKALFHITVFLIVVLSLLPFLWFVATSLKTEIEITAIPPVLVPSGTVRAYVSAIGIEQLNMGGGEGPLQNLFAQRKGFAFRVGCR